MGSLAFFLTGNTGIEGSILFLDKRSIKVKKAIKIDRRISCPESRK